MKWSVSKPKNFIDQDRLIAKGELYAWNIEEAQELFPGASMVVEVEGGFLVFDFMQDYALWENQI